MKLGVVSDCFKQSMVESIKTAASLGVNGIQMYAVKGEFCHNNLTEGKIEYYKKLLKENNLVVSAICGDFGRPGFSNAEENKTRITKTQQIVDLACKFDCKVVTTHIGVIPADKNCEKYKIMYDGIKECADYAHERGVTLAVETGPEIATTLKAFIEDVGEGIGVNLDPANFVMVTGQDPAEAVYLLKDYIVHTHMKDGKMLRKTGRAPELIYEQHLVDPEDLAKFSNLFIETPVGEGSVDWDKYIAALRDIGFNGYLTIERECGDNPAADIKLAADFARTNGWID